MVKPLRALACLLLLTAPALAAADLEAGAEAARAGDYQTALRQWRPLAERGDRDAQFNIGLLYENGLGVARDDAEALAWYRRAAELGDAGAQYNVGLFYAYGRGVAPSDVQAYAWLTVAQENGARRGGMLEALTKHMSAASIAQARRLVDEVRRSCKVD
ncbi:MAG: sel1 repeat family protein [Betaproteobacteria bacterium]|nr:sel1 repeat family protein [Betaproteobacteria bacterium]